MTPCERMAAFAAQLRSEDVPEEARAVARTAILDCLGVTLAGAREPVGRVMAGFLDDVGGRPAATVLGLGLRTSPDQAALANGTLAHALDYDDVAITFSGHPSAVLLPAALAAAEAEDASGDRLITAYAAGFEIITALGRALNPEHYERGWHATSTLGVFGAAAAAAHVMALPAAGTGTALALAASLSAGLRQNFGSMAKPFHAGSAARAGVAAAMLAARGMTAAADAIEGPYGFAALYGAASPSDLEGALEPLGKTWALAAEGIWVKKYACCASTHRALDALFALRAAHGFDHTAVASVVCRVPTIAAQVLIHPRPASALEGKFSMQYCLAAALYDGELTLGTFTDAHVQRPEVRALGERVIVEAIGDPPDEATEVLVRLHDGRTFSHTLIHPRGHPGNPLSRDELAAKFLDCAARSLPLPAAQEVLEVTASLDELPRARALTTVLRTASRR